MSNDKNGNLPVETLEQIVSLAQRFVVADSTRFFVFSPRENLVETTCSSETTARMEEQYADHWQDDPMHPSLYEDTNTTVVTNSQLMNLSKWKQSKIYLNFFAPSGITHNLDTFFRQDGKIIGILTLLRNDETNPFTQEDVKTIEKIQPFIEFSLGKVFLPKRITERNILAFKYGFTARELDVLEYALSGSSNKELVKHLDMSLPTLRTHLQNIYLKVDVHSTSELISKVLRETNFD